MNRRGMFKAIAGGAATVAVVSKVEWSEDFKGWNIRWTGWKDIANSVEIVGQYIAVKLNDSGKPDPYYPMVYASCPGTVDVFFRGDSFNIYYDPEQIRVNETSSKEDRLIAQTQTWASLIEFMQDKILMIDWKTPREFLNKESFTEFGLNQRTDRYTSELALPVNRLTHRWMPGFWEEMKKVAAI